MPTSKRIDKIENKLDKLIELSIKADNTLHGEIGLCKWMRDIEMRTKLLEKHKIKIIAYITILVPVFGFFINKIF